MFFIICEKFINFDKANISIYNYKYNLIISMRYARCLAIIYCNWDLPLLLRVTYWEWLSCLAASLSKCVRVRMVCDNSTHGSITTGSRALHWAVSLPARLARVVTQCIAAGNTHATQTIFNTRISRKQVSFQCLVNY